MTPKKQRVKLLRKYRDCLSRLNVHKLEIYPVRYELTRYTLNTIKAENKLWDKIEDLVEDNNG